MIEQRIYAVISWTKDDLGLLKEKLDSVGILTGPLDLALIPWTSKEGRLILKRMIKQRK